jgi:hypothetical protein
MAVSFASSLTARYDKLTGRGQEAPPPLQKLIEESITRKENPGAGAGASRIDPNQCPTIL